MSSGATSGTPAPSPAESNLFATTRLAQPIVTGTHFPAAWQRLTHALGHDLQHGMWRAEQARRRIARLR